MGAYSHIVPMMMMIKPYTLSPVFTSIRPFSSTPVYDEHRIDEMLKDLISTSDVPVTKVFKQFRFVYIFPIDKLDGDVHLKEMARLLYDGLFQSLSPYSKSYKINVSLVIVLKHMGLQWLDPAKKDFNHFTDEYVKITTNIENLKSTLDNTLFSIETTLMLNQNSLQDARESWNEFQKDINPIQAHEKTNKNKPSIIPDNIRARITPIGDRPGLLLNVLSSTPSLRKVSKSIKNTPSNKEILENAVNDVTAKPMSSNDVNVSNILQL